MHPIDERAREYARAAHRGQIYAEGDFFDLHLTRVVATLGRFGERNPVLLAAGWLHDVVEDTGTTVEALGQEFGEEIADLVDRLTDEREGSRRERQAKTHAKIRAHAGAVRVKLADRIANVEANIEMNSPLVDRMYRKEYGRFREALYRSREYEEMWKCLDSMLLPPTGPAVRDV